MGISQRECFVDEGGRADVGVAMNLPVAEEARVFKAGNEAQHAGLIAPLEVVLKADEVVAVGAQVFFAQLHDGPGSFAGAWVAQADGLHGAEAQGVAAAAREHFNGQAALEVFELLPLFALGGLGGDERVEKGDHTLHGSWGS